MSSVKVVFDSALDGPAWPGPLGQSDFVFGEAWVGPMGLIDVLETRLGMGGRFDGRLQRACRLAVRLRELSGYWRKSFDVDALGTCWRLLHDRDELRLWGWMGQPVSTRLEELQAATAEASPAVPDRLEAIAWALAVRSPGIESLVSHTVIAHLPPLWRRVFRALQHTGVAIEERTLAPAAALGDLIGARARFTPAGDGRLCLLRRHGPLDLADEIAGSLAASDSLDGVVIIGADGVLDQALARHGLPRVGGHTEPPASSRLLSLVIEAAFHPMEMGDLHALLAADPGPIPRHLAAMLIRAIRECPGRRTVQWNESLVDGLARTDAEKREELGRRVRELLLPVSGRDESLPVSALRMRLDALDAWARARAAFVPSLLELSDRIHTLLEVVDLMAASALSWHELRRLCAALGEPAWAWQPAQAGLVHVARPGAVLAPARAIIWWNFSRDTAARQKHLLLTRVERDGLRAADIETPDSSLAMAIEADGWRRPLSQAREALVLACPLTDIDGQPNHPHPLWDDIAASLADHRDLRKLERRQIVHLAPAKRDLVQPRSLLTPSPVVTLAAPIALCEIESPSSVEKLLGCSLAWALEYRARLGPGLSVGPSSPGRLLFGWLAHRILEQVLQRPLASPDESADLAGTLFDQQTPGICEDLELPQHQASRATVRRAVVESARELVRLARKHGARVLKTEVTGKAVAAGQVLEGRLDLLWDEPAVVLDLKWGKSAQVVKLKTGTAIQLSAYAAMREAEGQSAETAYFVLQNQDLLAEPGGRLARDAREQGSHRASETWSAVVATLQRRRDSLCAGRLEAPGATGDDVQPALSPDGLVVAPPCKHCRFTGLCGLGGAR
jgi:ATP-dependent helicase/nuclease subunit B